MNTHQLLVAARAKIANPESWTQSIIKYNDNHSHSEVLAVFDRATEATKDN